MLKVLIISKQTETAKKIINNILISLDNLKVMGIANNLEEAKELIPKFTVDLIITTNNINLENFIKENFFSYKPKLVIISNLKNSESTSRNTLIVNHNLSFSEISKKISIFINTKIGKSKKEKAINLLKKFGFDFKLSGTNYLLDAIMFNVSYNESFGFEKLVKDTYAEVAKMNNTRSDLVKWAITRSINYMHSRHTKESYIFVEEFFNIKYPERPTPKTIINLVSNTLNLN